MIQKILKLGNPALYEKSEEVNEDDLKYLDTWVTDLHDTLMEYLRIYGAGRAIAAPQIGIKKRILYMNTGKEYIFINPTLEFLGDEMFEVIDDCMSFPGLLVRVMRHKRTVIRYRDKEMNPCTLELKDDLSELIQHEYDHLDGILATMRAIDDKSFIINKENDLFVFQINR